MQPQTTRWLPIFALAALLIPAAGASASQQTPRVPDVVTLQVLLTSQGNGKVTTQTHSLELPVDGKVGQLRSGNEVPVTANGRTTFQQVGFQFDATVTAEAGGRFKVALTVTHRGVYEGKLAQEVQQVSGGIPVFRNFIVATTTILKDGENTLATATDLVSNEVWQVNVTLTLKK